MTSIEREVFKALQELGDRWQTDRNIFNHAFIKVEYLYDDGFTSDEVETICEWTVNEMTEYIKRNVHCNAAVKFDGNYVYIEEL